VEFMNNLTLKWKQKAGLLKREIYAVYLAYKDPRTPIKTKIFAACVLAYAFSPIDLIPDPIPILGYLDDLVIIPLGIAIVIKMIPSEILKECRAKANSSAGFRKKPNWIAGTIIILIWAILAIISIYFIQRYCDLL